MKAKSIRGVTEHQLEHHTNKYSYLRNEKTHCSLRSCYAGLIKAFTDLIIYWHCVVIYSPTVRLGGIKS